MSRARGRRRRRSRKDKFNPRTSVYAKRRGTERRQTRSVGAMVGLVVLTAIFIAGFVASQWPNAPEPPARELPNVAASSLALAGLSREIESEEFAPPEPSQARFDHCGDTRQTCVVDGDTFWLEGAKIRIADIDTPEISQPQCDYERALGDQATERLIELLNAGPFELQNIGNRDVDRYGRLLRVVVRDGRSLGDQLVAEGLARTWTGRREPWC